MDPQIASLCIVRTIQDTVSAADLGGGEVAEHQLVRLQPLHARADLLLQSPRHRDAACAQLAVMSGIHNVQCTFEAYTTYLHNCKIL